MAIFPASLEVVGGMNCASITDSFEADLNAIMFYT